MTRKICQFEPVPSEVCDLKVRSIFNFILYKKIRTLKYELIINKKDEIKIDEVSFSTAFLVNLPVKVIDNTDFFDKENWDEYVIKLIQFQILEMILDKEIVLYNFRDTHLLLNGLSSEIVDDYLLLNQTWNTTSDSLIKNAIFKASNTTSLELKEMISLDEYINRLIAIIFGDNLIHDTPFKKIAYLTALHASDEFDETEKKEGIWDYIFNLPLAAIFNIKDPKTFEELVIIKEKRIHTALKQDPYFNIFNNRLIKAIDSNISSRVSS